MAPLTPNSSADSPNESPPSSSYHSRSKPASETQRDEAKIVFNKTIEGHYRHGKTGYRQVGALFLTWRDDDMQCKETEVDKLRQLFASDFNFKTVYFEIPSQRWETALHKAVADFCYEYDSPEDLAIVYYGGHAYTGTETNHFKLAAKINNRKGNGDPTAFFPDVLTCLRLPACDQLLILDCCFAAKAFAREHIGKRKFELLTSAAHDARCPAPKSEISFTRTLTTALRSLLKENPKGFSTTDLYREVYHTVPLHSATTKPLLFDQSRHNFGKIWLMPQVLSDRPPKTEEEGRFLKLTFRLNEDPNLAVMNELALKLQYLPHVDQIKFDDLYAPREQITNFMAAVVQAQKLKPLIRKMLAKRRFQKLTELKTGDNGVKASESLLKLHLEQNHHPVYDWSRAKREPGHDPKDSEEARDRRKRIRTWPPAEAKSYMDGPLSGDRLSAEYKVDLPGPGTLVTTFVPRGVNTTEVLAHEQANGTTASTETSQAQNRDGHKRQRSTSPDRDAPPEKRAHMVD
ncbi:MAG: hypothetical protein ALECFALPRED_000370 [Alectoria fallacina]|uniref:Uncharacterized protein n=1 Tax=Alectoria fallacina TaxID=1903189 RepID=A0A8H3IGH5_9LECA|nr:MAG: hypothetical protein ALECFALPRED_000370 [Alectoria fallacina]